MNVTDLMKYLATVQVEAGDIPVIVQPEKAHAHLLENVEVVDRARYWGKEVGLPTEILKRAKAVVIR